jgi:hypothetical protein
MKSFKWIGFLTLLSCLFFIGCDGAGTATESAAEQDEIAAWAAAHPDEEEGLEPEAEVLDADENTDE